MIIHLLLSPLFRDLIIPCAGCVSLVSRKVETFLLLRDPAGKLLRQVTQRPETEAARAAKHSSNCASTCCMLLRSAGTHDPKSTKETCLMHRRPGHKKWLGVPLHCGLTFETVPKGSFFGANPGEPHHPHKFLSSTQLFQGWPYLASYNPQVTVGAS